MRVGLLALALVGCGEGEPLPADSDVLGPCEGAGEGTVALGTGGLSGFAPFEDGGEIATIEGTTGDWVLQIELLTTGLDTTEGATTVVRVRYEPGAPTEDYVGQVMLQCDEEAGVAWAGVQAAIPEPWQGYPGSLVGASIEVDATITDATGEAASDGVTLTVTAR